MPDPEAHLTNLPRRPSALQRALGTRTLGSQTLLSPRGYGVLVALLLLGSLFPLGWITQKRLDAALQERVRDSLSSMLENQVNALVNWLETQKKVVTVMAARPEIRRGCNQAVDHAGNDAPTETPQGSAEYEALADQLAPIMQIHSYLEFSVLDPDGTIILSSVPALVGQRAFLRHPERLEALHRGETVLGLPLQVDPALFALERADSLSEMMFVAAPVRDEAGEKVRSILSFIIAPDRDFTRILRLGRLGETGETYAFGEDAIMLSDSRFDEQLAALGILPSEPGARAMLSLDIRSPEGDMTRGYQPTIPRRAMPLTWMAADVLSGRPEIQFPRIGSNVHGYPDYRGVPVVGAWTWLKNYGLAVTTELDVEEAFLPLRSIQFLFRGLFTVVVVGGCLYLVNALRLSRARRQMSRAMREARRLGQYALEKKIGEGGMGEVYQASHVMLRRPTAIKLLPPDKSSVEAIARFEREVQLTSRLSHPNTIEIYDFGRTPEGIFFYAMEYLEGVDLSAIAPRTGPLPPARLIFLLRQVLGSLQEAHELGLIHRDIKPQNLFLCRRGGMYDVVKVLDFGLVKDIGDEHALQLTRANASAGSPMFISPEAISAPASMDARSDLYSLGVVAYYLASGVYPFAASSLHEIYQHHLKDAPAPLASHDGIDIPQDLEALIMQCLAKQPDDRPASARVMLRGLENCRDANAWGQQEAEDWWMKNASWLTPQVIEKTQVVDRMAATMVQPSGA